MFTCKLQSNWNISWILRSTDHQKILMLPWGMFVEGLDRSLTSRIESVFAEPWGIVMGIILYMYSYDQISNLQSRQLSNEDGNVSIFLPSLFNLKKCNVRTFWQFFSQCARLCAASKQNWVPQQQNFNLYSLKSRLFSLGMIWKSEETKLFLASVLGSRAGSKQNWVVLSAATTTFQPLCVALLLTRHHHQSTLMSFQIELWLKSSHFFWHSGSFPFFSNILK